MLDAENSTESPTGSTGSPEPVEPAAEAPADTTTGTAPEPTPADTADAAGTAAETTGDEPGAAPAKKTPAKRAAAKKTTAKKATTKKTAAKRITKKVAEPGPTESVPPESAEAAEMLTASVQGASTEAAVQAPGEMPAVEEPAAETLDQAPAAKRTAKKATKKAAAKRTTKKAAAALEVTEAGEAAAAAVADETTAPTEAAPGVGVTSVTPEGDEQADQPDQAAEAASAPAGPPPATALLFQPPDPTKAVTRRRRTAKAAESADAEAAAERAPEEATGEERRKPAKKAAKKPAKKPVETEPEETPEAPSIEEAPEQAAEESRQAGVEGEEDQAGERRRRRRGGRRRRRSGGGEDNGAEAGQEPESNEGQRSEQKDQNGPGAQGEPEESEEGAGGTRRRRRRRRSGENGEGSSDESEGTVTRVRKPRNAEDEITALSGSTRLEAKKQRRREGREAGRRRAPIVSEAEFLARRESVDRVMVIRQREDLTQIAVLEDKVLVEHYVARESQTSLIGNVYLGRVQNVLPSMEAAFIDIGKGRNAVLYAGEVNWDALGAKNGQPRKIEAVLKSGQSILVQVTKDPIGHKGARLTSQISLPGRFLVYVPDGTTSGISRKLPDTERNRLKSLLKDIVPDTAGVIVRTAAEGASEDELTRDVERLTARWSDIESKVKGGNAPQLLYGEPDLTLKVVRDLFTEDFQKLVIAGDDAWDMVEGYVSHVAPDLAERLERYDGERDVFAEYRIDEQIEKALDRKVWLPSGGSLVIDRTEAMTVVDVNTGKFTGSGGNLEETVTKNNLEAAEEIVRQLRLRDIGGIIVVDFIDMVLESNRDLVLRRLVECLGRDRTRHQVAEVTSLGLVQMTRKRIGTGLLEAFSETCEHCQGRGLILHHEPVEPKKKGEDESRRGRRSGRGRGREEGAAASAGNGGGVPSPKDIAAMAKPEEKHEERAEERAGGAPEGGPDGSQAAAEVTSHEAEAGSEAAEATVEAGETAEAQPTEGKGGGRSRGGRGRRGRGGSEGQAERGAEPSPEREEPSREGAEPSPEVSEAAVATSRSEEPAGPVQTGSETGELPKGEEQAAAEAATPEPPAPPAAPKIVTSVRRRSARRPAGPPAAAAPAPSQAASTALPSPNVVDAAVGQRANGQVSGAAAEEVTDEPADAEPLSSLVDAAEDGADVDDAEMEVPATPHVPVKKKGSRRR